MLILRSFFDGDGDRGAVAPREIALLSEERSFSNGELLYDPATPISRAYFIFDGEVELEYQHTGQKQIFGTGFGIGHIAIMTGISVYARATALGDVSTLAIESPHLQQVMAAETEQILRAMRLMGELLAERYEGVPPAGLELGGPNISISEPPETMDLADLLLFLFRGPGSMSLNAEGIAALARSSTYRVFEPGEVIWRADDPPAFYATRVAGSLRVVRPDGRTEVYARDVPIGIWDRMLQGVPAGFELRAETRAGVVCTNCEGAMATLEDHPRLAILFLQLTSRIALGIRPDTGLTPSPEADLPAPLP